MSPHNTHAPHPAGKDSPTEVSDLRLPNGLTVTQINTWETLATYHEIFVERSYLPDALRRPPAGGVIVDVGANIGLTTVFFAIEAPGARILAVEPAALPRRALEANVERFRAKAAVCAVAVDARAGRREFAYYPTHSISSGLYADPTGDANGDLTFFRNAGVLGRGDPATAAELSEVERYTCEVVTLTELLAERSVARVDLLKIDAERAEHGIFAGISHELWAGISQLVVEVHDGPDIASSLRDVIQAQGMQAVVKRPRLATGDESLLYGWR
jgi:31-O-methyltransferase